MPYFSKYSPRCSTFLYITHSFASGKMAPLIYFYFMPYFTVTMVVTLSCHMQLNAECTEKCNSAGNIWKSRTLQYIFYMIEIFENKSNKVEILFSTFFKINTVIKHSFQILNIYFVLTILILIILVSTIRYIWVVLYTMSNLMSISLHIQITQVTTKKTMIRTLVLLGSSSISVHSSSVFLLQYNY
jgi:hypothetical protein